MSFGNLTNILKSDSSDEVLKRKEQGVYDNLLQVISTTENAFNIQ